MMERVCLLRVRSQSTSESRLIYHIHTHLPHPCKAGTEMQAAAMVATGVCPHLVAFLQGQFDIRKEVRLSISVSVLLSS